MDGVEVYRSETLLVRAIPGADRARWVVTFDNFGAAEGLDRPGFGEHYLVGSGISAIIVTARGNDWYQYPDMEAALAAIRAYVAGADRVLTYGSSMGAYAAIRFADRIGAHACLALSPQYSIDPRKAPFERRWTQQSSSIKWIEALDRRIACAIRPVVVYDDRGVDRRHVEMIAADAPITPVAIPYAGHPVTVYLSSAGLLQTLVPALLEDRLDPAWLKREAMKRRHNDPVLLVELARRQPAHRNATGIAIARRALERAPGSDLVHHMLAERLTMAGRFEEALQIHARAVALSRGVWSYELQFAKALAAAGRRDEALALAIDLTERHPAIAMTHAALGRMLWGAGRRAEASRAMMRAHRLDRGNRGYLGDAVRFSLLSAAGVARRALTAPLRWLALRASAASRS